MEPILNRGPWFDRGCARLQGFLASGGCNKGCQGQEGMVRTQEEMALQHQLPVSGFRAISEMGREQDRGVTLQVCSLTGAPWPPGRMQGISQRLLETPVCAICPYLLCTP